MVRELTIKIIFEDDLSEEEIKETGRAIMGELLESFYICNIGYLYLKDREAL